MLAGILAWSGARAEYRGPQNRTVYDDWIADSRAQRDAESRAKAWEDRAGRSGYTDYSSDLAWLNQQSRLQKEWEEEDRRASARRAARAAARAEQDEKERRLLALYDKASAGDADALMSLAAREETSEASRWGIRKYEVVFGPRRPEALRRIVALLRAHADKPDAGRDFRSVQSFLTELADLGDRAAAKEVAASLRRDGEYEGAANYFCRSAEGGDRESARAAIALLAEDRVDDLPAPTAAFSRWCSDEAAQGNLQGGYVLGRALCHGYGADKDPVKALDILRRTATTPASGLSPAQASARAKAAELAGRMLCDGAGVPADTSAGVALLEASASAGNIAAMSRLGKIHYLGTGVSPDTARARLWLTKAAELGDAPAAALLSMICLRPDAGSAEQSEGVAWLRKAAKRHPEAMLRYGRLLYEGGFGMEPDREEAAAYFARAFRQYPDDGGVLDFVGASYLEGRFGVRLNPAEGVRILTLAYDRGNLRSASRLAEAYRTGNGVAADPEMARLWAARVR